MIQLPVSGIQRRHPECSVLRLIRQGNNIIIIRKITPLEYQIPFLRILPDIRRITHRILVQKIPIPVKTIVSPDDIDFAVFCAEIIFAESARRPFHADDLDDGEFGGLPCINRTAECQYLFCIRHIDLIAAVHCGVSVLPQPPDHILHQIFLRRLLTDRAIEHSNLLCSCVFFHLWRHLTTAVKQHDLRRLLRLAAAGRHHDHNHHHNQKITRYSKTGYACLTIAIFSIH